LVFNKANQYGKHIGLTYKEIYSEETSNDRFLQQIKRNIWISFKSDFEGILVKFNASSINKKIVRYIYENPETGDIELNTEEFKELYTSYTDNVKALKLVQQLAKVCKELSKEYPYTINRYTVMNLLHNDFTISPVYFKNLTKK